ncbi:MAG: hypothetical protein E6R06_25795 [Mycobacterium sp.]|nr:MAG: hypothetical protein E6R06_25795 [Mycobacterium sp.]
MGLEVKNVVATPPLPRWASTHMTFRDAVRGLDCIATQSIPYTRVSGRGKSAYTSTYRRWEDLAGETVGRLLRLPGGGERTLQQIVDIAREEVAAHQRARARPRTLAAAAAEMIGRLDPRHRALLAARHWSDEPRTSEQIEQQLAVYRGWATRYYPKAQARFAELMSEPRYRQICEVATELRQDFGPYVPDSLVARRFKDMGLPTSNEAARVLLYAAGPYNRRGDWFENPTIGGYKALQEVLQRIFDDKLAKTLDELKDTLIGAGVLPAIAPYALDLVPLRKFGDIYVQWGPGPAPAQTVVEDLFKKQPAVTVGELHAALAAAGIPQKVLPAVAAGLLQQLHVRRFGDVYVRWSPWPAEQITAVLHAYSKPLTPTEILEHLGDTTLTEATVRNALANKPIFQRTAPGTWGMRSWRMREYRGLADELGQRIDASGGVMPIAELMAMMKHDFPEASEVSLEMYTQTLAFVIHDGMIRRRIESDPWPAVRHWNTVAGVFRGPSGDLRVIRPVTSELLRGTSQTIKKSVATALGVTPGGRKTFRTEAGDLTIYWLLSTPGAPHISSLQAIARSVDAVAGDELALTFKRTRATAERIPRRLSTEKTFQLVTGRPTLSLATLAASLDCPPEKVVALLSKRGDEKLAAAARKLRR